MPTRVPPARIEKAPTTAQRPTHLRETDSTSTPSTAVLWEDGSPESAPALTAAHGMTTRPKEQGVMTPPEPPQRAQESAVLLAVPFRLPERSPSRSSVAYR